MFASAKDNFGSDLELLGKERVKLRWDLPSTMTLVKRCHVQVAVRCGAVNDGSVIVRRMGSRDVKTHSVKLRAQREMSK